MSTRLDRGRLGLLFAALAAMSGACSGESEALVLLDVEIAADIPVAPEGFKRARFSVQERGDIPVRMVDEDPRPAKLTIGYYLRGAHGTVNVLGEILNQQDCVIGEGAVRITNVSPGKVSAPVPLLVEGLGPPRCSADGGANRDTLVADAHEGGAEAMPETSLDGGGDAVSTCESPQLACVGMQCVDVANNSSHCGSCGHSCLGGQCRDGVCGVLVLEAGVRLPRSVAVDPDFVYFSADGLLARCPLPLGCTLAPAVLAADYPTMGDIAVSHGSVYWTSGSLGDSDNNFIRSCPSAGCPATPKSFDSTLAMFSGVVAMGSFVYWLDGFYTGIQRLCVDPSCGAATAIATAVVPIRDIKTYAVDETDVYFVQADRIWRCPLGGSCASPVNLRAAGEASQLAIYGGMLFWASPGVTAGPNGGYVYSCPKDACTTATPFAREASGPAEVVVDSTGVYWLNPTQGAIRTCPVSGCVGAPRLLASEQAGAASLTIDSTAVYWVVSGAPLPAAPSGAIMKVAK